jgi:C4-type Zn-finger protein
MCPYCNRPLMKINHYGEVLVGSIDCNRCGHPGEDKLIMELLDSDLEVLRQRRQQ